jgi:nicotinamide-nucleotide amidase
MLLTRVSGNSAYFKRSVVAYSNVIKEGLCGIPQKLMNHSGAVSVEVAATGATKVQSLFATQLGLYAGCIAGPRGGSEQKPVGTIVAGCAMGNDYKSQRVVFPGDRDSIRICAAKVAVDLARRMMSTASYDNGSVNITQIEKASKKYPI